MVFQHLQQRKNGNYYYRKRVPDYLRPVIGKSEIVKSLKTTNNNEAFKKACKLEVKINDYIEALEGGDTPENDLTTILGRGVKHTLYKHKSKEIYLDNLFQKWIKNNQPSESSVYEWRTNIKHFNEINGKLPINDINIDHVIKFRNIISECPARFAFKYPDKTIIEVFKKYKNKIEYTKVSTSTVAKKITSIKSLLNLALNEGYIRENPASQIRILKNQKSSSKRESFNDADLNKIFTENFQNQGYKFWIAYIALYSGMRLEEIGGLTKDDIKKENDIYYFDVKPNKYRGLKTQSSIRKVPLHKQLIDHGFIEYINSFESDKLFPELKPNSTGKLTKYYSNWFSRYLKKVEIDDASKVFHSFRHGFKESCRNCEMPEDISDALTGHSSASVGRRYGGNYSIEILNKWIQKVKLL
jgi:integrase